METITPEISTADMARLRWRCRRGLLELDLSLGMFVEHHYVDLDPTLKMAFWQLLNESDHSILSWLHGTEACTNSNLKQIINIIIQAIENKHKKIKNS